MKKICLFLAAFCVLTLGATILKPEFQHRNYPRTVQGTDYRSTLPEDIRKAAAKSDYPEDPGDLAVPDGDFTFDMIENWTGEGANKAALVIQWNDSKEKNALVFGYRWNGQATGADMIRAVVAANPQLYGLIQYTNVSSPTDPNGGYTINGFGWDADGDGDIALIDTGNGNQIYESETGLFIHPRGYVPGQGGSSDYDYDNWKARDTDDFWGAGWYLSYWSYWVKESEESTFGYSGWGASGRVLQDGSWDGWNFAVGMMASDWKSFKAAPAPIPDNAKTEFKINGIYYELKNFQNKTVAVTAPREMESETLTSYDGEVTIPATFVDGEFTYNVTSIDAEAFKNSTVTSVTMPKSVTGIGKSAFESSTLATLAVKDGEDIISSGTNRFDHVTKLGDAAFKGCGSFKDIFYPASVKNIGASLYEGTAVETVNLPSFIENVGESAFAGCDALKTVTLPKSLKGLGAKAFAGCDALTMVKCVSTAPLQITDDTFSATAYQNAALNVPNGYSDVYKNATGWGNFIKFDEFTLSVDVNDRFVMKGVSYRVTSMGEGANNVCVTYMPIEGASNRTNLKEANKAYTGDIVVPDAVTYQNINFNVTAVNDSAFFEAAGITSLSLPDAITRIGKNVCYDCTGITAIKFPSDLKSLGDYALAYTKIQEAVLPEGFETVGVRAFMSCSALKSVSLPSTLKAISDYGFYGCGLEQVNIPDGVTGLGTNVFQSNKSLKTVKLPGNIIAIPNYFFSDCSALENVHIPESVTELKSAVFRNCSNLKIDIPSGISKMGSEVFSGCSSLETMTVPASIKAIPTSLFNNCKSLTTVTMAPDVTTFGANLFSGCTSLRELRFSDSQTSKTSVAPKDATAAITVSLPSTLTEIGNYCFNKCTSINGFNLPDGLLKIGQYAFADNASLTDIRIPETVTSIGAYAFRSTGLTYLVIPASVTSLGTYIAQNCTGIKFYICNPKPGSCSGTTFSPKGYSDTSTLIVPTGSQAAYQAANYWKKNTIVSPTVTSLTIGQDIAASTSQGLTTLEIPFSFGYDMENLPEQFIAANKPIAANASAMSLTYKADESSDVQKENLVCVYGKLVATGLTLAKNTIYTARVSATLPDDANLTSSDFSISRGATAVPDKIKVWYGEGPDHVQVMMRFNDGKGVENITAGVRFTAPASVQSIMESLVTNDRRFYALKINDEFIGYGFDLNGDNVIGLTADSELSGENGVFTSSSDAVATPSQEYDHWAQNSGNNVWKAFRGEDFGQEFTPCESVQANDLLLLDFTDAETPQSISYVTYLEDAATVGAWIPEGLNIAMADEAYVPVLINVGAGNALRSLSWRYRDADGNTDNKVISRATLSNPTKGNTQALITFGNNTGEAYLSVKPNFSKGTSDYTDPVKVEVSAPVIPITSIAYSYGENGYDAHFTEAFQPELVITPADATYTKLTYTTSNRNIASVSNTGKVTCNRTEGTATITAKYDYNSEVTAQFNANVALRNPVQKIDIDGVDGDVITLNPKHLIGLIGKFTPENADIKDFDVTLEGAGSSADKSTLIASMYKVNYWDENNNRLNFAELSGHHAGECKLVLKAKDGSNYTREYTVKVVDQDRTPVAPDTYLDGTIILNEEWFGHTNGGMNFLTKDKNIMYQVYERENPGMSFGCTSQYGTIWNDKLLIASKQASDGGDPLPGGGRLVVADAKTFKRIGSIDDIKIESESRSGDGRAIAGATPDKIYMGTHQGIYVIDLNEIKVTGKIGDDGASTNLYDGQIGDMVNAGKHVFAIKQNTGVFIIDVDTDQVVKTISDANVQGITVSADGNVWVATLTEDKKASKFVCIDPLTLEENADQSVLMPESIGMVSCGWGAWRTTQFFGCNSKNVLWFSPGSSISNGGDGRFYCWEIGTDPTDLKPVFSLSDPVLPGHNKTVAQATYGTSRFDDRTGELIVMTTEYKASGHYRYNWTHFVDPATGKINRTIELEPYYWFQSMPIFPDKEDARLAEDFKGLEIAIDESNPTSQPVATLDLRSVVSDPDNNDAHIRFSLPQPTALDNAENINLATDLNDGILTVRPSGLGAATALVNATSNGRTVTLSIPVIAKVSTGINEISNGKSIRLIANRLHINGYCGSSFSLYDVNGIELNRFDVDSDDFVAAFSLGNGVYLLRSDNASFKFVVR